MKHKDRLNFGSSNAGCMFNKTIKTWMFLPNCLYTRTKQHLHPTAWAPVAFLRATTDQGQWKVSGTPPGILLRHHKNLAESSKRHLATQQNGKQPNLVALLCPRWASLMGHCHLAVPRPGLLWTALGGGFQQHVLPKPWGAAIKPG